MGINSGKFTAPSFGSAPVWCQNEHESTKIVALTHKVSPFTAIRSGFGPVVGLSLDYPLVSTNGHQPAENGRQKVYSRVGYPFFTLGTAIRTLYLLMGIDSAKVCASPQIFFRVALYRSRPFRSVTSRPSYLLMHIDLAKTTALPQKIFRQPLLGRSPLSRVEPALISPNAQRLGKIERLA
jgi:hypothetical protein